MLSRSVVTDSLLSGHARKYCKREGLLSSVSIFGSVRAAWNNLCQMIAYLIGSDDLGESVM